MCILDESTLIIYKVQMLYWDQSKTLHSNAFSHTKYYMEIQNRYFFNTSLKINVKTFSAMSFPLISS